RRWLCSSRPPPWSVSGLARQRRDRDALVRDLGDLGLDVAAEEVGIGAAEDDPGPLTQTGHIQDDSTDRLADAERLTRDLLRSGQKGFHRPEADLGSSPVEMLNRSREEVADAEAGRSLVV